MAPPPSFCTCLLRYLNCWLGSCSPLHRGMLIFEECALRAGSLPLQAKDTKIRDTKSRFAGAPSHQLFQRPVADLWTAPRSSKGRNTRLDLCGLLCTFQEQQTLAGGSPCEETVPPTSRTLMGTKVFPSRTAGLIDKHPASGWVEIALASNTDFSWSHFVEPKLKS